jgi:predicted nuclease with TOPRIM domain
MNAETAAEVRATEQAARNVIAGQLEEINDLRAVLKDTLEERDELREQLARVTADRARLQRQVEQLYQEGRQVASITATYFTRISAARLGSEFPEAAPTRSFSVARADARGR